jgi:hypothetical protein
MRVKKKPSGYRCDPMEDHEFCLRDTAEFALQTK